MPSRGNARRPLDSSPPDRLSTGSPQKEPRERCSPFIPAPYVNVARRSRDGARVDRLRKGPTRRTAVEGTCAGMRAGAARRGLESAWVRPRIVVEVASPPPVPSALSGCARKSMHEHPMETRKRNRRVGGDASDRGAPYVFTTCGSETISAGTEAFLAQNRDARRRGRRQGRQRWSESAPEQGTKTPDSRDLEPPKRARRRENAVRTGLPKLSRSRLAKGRARGGTRRDSVATRYDGCPFQNPWMSRSRPHASFVHRRVSLARGAELARALTKTGDLVTKTLRRW